MMRTLVITALAAGAENGARRPWAAARRAIDLLTSRHDRLIVDGLDAVWERWGREILDLAVLSRVHGLVGTDEILVPAEEMWDQGEEAHPAGEPADAQIPEQVAALASAYELVLYLLSGPTLAALRLPLSVSDRVQQLVFTDEETLAWVPAANNLHAVVADGSRAAQRWHVKAGHVRGFLFRRLCSQIEQHGPVVLEWVRLQPLDVEQLFYKRTRWRPQFPLW